VSDGSVAALAGLPPAVLVGLGGTFGALSRYAVDRALSGHRATFAVNVLGSVALGAVVAAPLSSSAATAVGTGFCGAFTTFSSFAVNVAEWAVDGRRREAAGYALLTLLSAVGGVALGGLLVTAT
jgi:CrcB protein